MNISQSAAVRVRSSHDGVEAVGKDRDVMASILRVAATGGDRVAKHVFRLMVAGAGAMWAASPASAATVECRSVDYSYTECSAGSLRSPQLIHQISSSACILNRSWGYNPRSGYLWVAEGCAGVFADPSGYHYGRGGGYDPNARSYDDRGHDVGAVVGGALLGALIAGIAKSGHDDHHHETTNYNTTSAGGRYTGCHGLGCLVGDSPPEPGQTQFRSNRGQDAPPEPGQTEFRGNQSDAPPEPGQNEMSDPQP